MMKYLLLILAISSLYPKQILALEQFKTKQFIENLKKPNNWLVIEQYFDQGPMNGFFDYNTTIEILQECSKAFPELVKEPFEFGRTFLNNTMYASAITLLKDNLEDAQGILINSLHHGREMLSLSMQLYTFAKIISDYVSQNQNTHLLLSDTVIWFIPAVNTDGLIKVKDLINNPHQRLSVRKNYNRGPCRFDNQGGVDLNRNYDDHFALDSNGSSGDPCDESYRGPKPFSEPETQAMKKFIEDRKNIKLAFNLHTYGNMWIRPINYSYDKENTLLKKMHKAYNIYQEFDTEVKFVFGTKLGNAIKALEHLGGAYTANGEATDWMLLQKKIIAFSPEIGQENTDFFPEKYKILQNLKDNYPPINYMIMKLIFSPQLYSASFLNSKQKNQIIKKYQLKSQDKSKLKVFSIEIFNQGLGDLKEMQDSQASIEFGFQRIINSDSIKEEQTQQDQSGNQTLNKYHSFHIQNIYYIDYDEDYRFEKLENIGEDDLNAQIIDFKLNSVDFTKNTEIASIRERMFKKKFSTYKCHFNQDFKGRSFRKYFIVYTTPMTSKDSFNLSIRIITDNNDTNRVLTLFKENIFIDSDGKDKPINEVIDQSQKEDNLEQVSEPSEDQSYYYTIIFLLGFILILLILKLIRKQKINFEKFANEISHNNMIEIN